MRFAIEQFDAVFAVRDGSGNPYLLIGGQAVYFWASRYAAEESSLEQWRPFTSADIDFRGSREDVVNIARQLGRAPKFPHRIERTALSGIIPFTIADVSVVIEVVRSVPGVKSEAAAKLGIEREFLGKLIRVLDPISLLCGKAYLALKVNQKERRDVEHLQIMVVCARAFLREVLRGVEAGELVGRGWLAAVERVLKLAESATGRKAARKFGVDWQQTLPEKEITASKHRLVVSFREKRLAQWRKKIV
ncbi:MAG: hypothetical protein RL380_883 [Verrucomicrobiota bacterium]